MNKRKFLKSGSLLGLLGMSGASLSGHKNNSAFVCKEDDLNSFNKLVDLGNNSKPMKYDVNLNYTVLISNVHTEHYKSNKNIYKEINSDNLYSFSMTQGEYALQVIPMTHDFTHIYLYRLDGGNYILIGDNITYTHSKDNSSMTWLSEGIEVHIKKTKR